MRKIALTLILLSVFGLATAQSEKDSVNKQTQSEKVVITQPEFKGGIEKMYEYITTNFQYPEDAKKRSVRGKMEVEFTVEKSGDITYVGILKGLDYSIDLEQVKELKRYYLWGGMEKEQGHRNDALDIKNDNQEEEQV